MGEVSFDRNHSSHAVSRSRANRFFDHAYCPSQPDRTMDESTATLRAEIRAGFRELEARIDKLESTSNATSNRIREQVESLTLQQALQGLIADIVLCACCTGVSLAIASIDALVQHGCDALPGWASSNLPMCQPSKSPAGDVSWRSLFDGGSNSVAAVAIGNAEGTRTPDGGKTVAYGGHSDPGNGVWNMGTFSYQHGADSPQEADRKQLQRLKGQVDRGLLALEARGIKADGAIALNLADLYNQSPQAASYFPDAFQQCQQSGKMGDDLILCARVRSYGGDAPGLSRAGVTIEADQNRRMGAIAKVLASRGGKSDRQFVTPTTGDVSSGYGYRSDPMTGEKRFHAGIDFAAPIGTPIIAATGGTVTTAGDDGDGYGLKVIIDHGDGYQTLYGHASELLVRLGQRVKQGEAIALVGSTGRSTGAHLHFEIIKKGEPIDPAPLLH